MEHRWGRRVDCQIPVVVEAMPLAQVSAQIQNLSLSGAFLGILRMEEIPPTVCVRFAPTITVPHLSHLVFAHVVRRTRDGIGLEWAEFAPQIIHLHFALPPEEIQAIRLMHATTVRDRRLPPDPSMVELVESEGLEPSTPAL
jgi:hypothetical protein